MNRTFVARWTADGDRGGRNVIDGFSLEFDNKNITENNERMEDEESVCGDSSSGDDCFVFTQEDLPTISFPVFDELRKTEKLVDIRLKVGDKEFSAHRVVLASTIPYFHAMFTHDMLESSKAVIEIQESIEGYAFESLIDYAYSGQLRITSLSVQSLMVAASFLQLQRVCEACCEFLKNRLHVSNVLGVQAFADTLGCISLVESAKKFVQKQFEEVAKSEEFLSLNFIEITEIISKDELNVSAEEKVFEAVMTWVKKDEQNRKEYLPNLLTHVRLPLLTPQYLTDYVATEQLIRNSHSCRDLLDEAKDYHLMPERRHLLQSFRTRPRCCSDLSGLIYAVGGLTKNGDSLSTVEVFNPQQCVWKMAEAMTMLRSRVGVAVMHNKLYAIGGYDGQERLSTVEVFDPQAKRWTKVAPMNCKRSAVGAATLNNRLYVCGGYDGISSLSTVECYDHEKDEWRMVPCMSKHRSAAGVVAFQGNVYALGGHDGLSIFDSVEKYDPQTKRWTSMPSMQTKRCRLGVATLSNKIYICGGYDGSTFLQTAEVFDPQTNEWSFLASMNVMRSRVALVANNGKLFAIGGYDGVSNLSSVEMYNPETNEWSFVAPMCAHEGGVGVGVIPFLNCI